MRRTGQVHFGTMKAFRTGNLRAAWRLLSLAGSGGRSAVPCISTGAGHVVMRGLLASLVLMGASGGVQGRIWRVSGARPLEGVDGRTWASAVPNIFDAATYAKAGDQIWVREGTYTRDEGVSASVEIPRGVAVYGGFSGTEEDLAARAGGETVLLRISVGLGGSNRLDRLTIRRASRSSLRPIPVENQGGGLRCYGGEVEIVDCRLENNGASYGGGGYFENASLLMRNCVLSSNNAVSIFIPATTGAALCIRGGNAVIADCHFLDNDGRGVVEIDDATFELRHSTFVSSPGRPGNSLAFGTFRSTGSITACQFLGFTTRVWTAGMFIYDPKAVVVSSCLFYGGSASAPSPPVLNGEVIAFHGSGGARFVNNTIVSNALPALRCRMPGVVIGNNLIVGNEAGIVVETNRVLPRNNDVFGNLIDYVGIPDPTGTYANVSADPLFAGNLAVGDARLHPNSPCRDAGDPRAVLSEIDLDGQPRTQGPRPDIGASEYPESGQGMPPSLTLQRAPARLLWIGETGASYRVWRSSDLRFWNEWMTIDASPTSVPYSLEVDLTTPASFFRLSTP